MRALKHGLVGQSRRLGLTMVEVLIVAIILSMLIAGVGLTVRQGSGAYTQGVNAAEVEAGARRLAERIARELVDASSDPTRLNCSIPQAGPSWVEYQRCQGFDAGAVIWTPTRRLQLVLQPGELDNGVDDNSNGLVDEHRVELRPDWEFEPDMTVGWGGFVREYLEGEVPNNLDDNGNGLADERGLCLEWNEALGLLTVRVTLERLDSLGRPLTRTIETAVQIRND